MLDKKCFLVGIITLLSASLAISAQPVHPTTGEPLVIDCLRGTPDAIDGDLSDWNLEAMTPAALDAVEQLYSGQENWTGPEDCSGEFYLLWDDVNIYIAVVVKDEKLSMNKSGGDIWNADCVEVFFATTDARADHSWSNPTIHYQYGFNANNQKWNWCNMDGPGQSEPDYLQIAATETVDGYICEASIEYGQMLSLDFSAGNTIGFHSSIDDTDIENGDTELFMTWTGLGPHDQSMGFGHMVLSADAAPGPEPKLANPVHSYTFEDGTANDSVGSAHGTLVGDAAVTGGALVLDGDGDWMSMPGEVIAMNTYSEVTVETWFTSVAGGNTGFHMLAAFGEEGTGANPGFGYKYLFITPARGDDVSRAAIQTSSMDDSPWDEETGVSAAVEHDDGIEHHFVATVDATNITFYIDGELIGSEPLAAGNEIAGIGQAVAYLGKGVYGVDPLWTGSVNEFNIYDRALSLAEVQANYAAGPVKPLVHSYTFEDGTANDSVGSAHGTLVGDATIVDGQLVLDGDGDWMDMPGDIIAMNTFEELTIEIMFTSVAGGNTGYHMVTAFGEEGTGDNPGYGYKYVCITPARGNDVSRGMIQTVSMDNDPWSEETGVSDVIEHDDGLPHHMVCTVDDTELAFYIDGVLIGAAALDPPGNSIAGLGTDVARIGKGVYGVDPLWAGSVEELNIYNRALSPAEVQANYAAGPQKAGPAPVDPGTEGLMVHFPLDTASRGVTQDSSDNDRDGTLFGDPTFVEGVDIMALDFDGVDDYVDTDYTEDLAVWTIACWAKSPAAPSGDPSSASGPVHREKNYQFNWNHQSDDFRGSAALRVGGTWHAAKYGEVEADTWYHLAATYDGEELKAYKDGVLITTNDAPSGPPDAEAGTLKLGKHATAEQYFTGTVDEARIYNRALSPEEVLFLAGK